MQRAYRYRFYPTSDQQALLIKTLGCVRYVYNWALTLQTEAWAQRQERLTYGQTSAHLTALKRDPEHQWLWEVSSVPVQQAMRHLDAGFKNFRASRARHPRFKRKHDRQAAEFTRSAFSVRQQPDGTVALHLAKLIEPLSIRWSRPLPPGVRVSTVTVSLDQAGRWFVSLWVDEDIAPLPAAEAAVGLDAGLHSLLALSTGEKISNPRHLDAHRYRLHQAHRALRRKQKGSANKAKAQRRVARAFARVVDARRDYLHKLTTRLVRENQTIVIEDLHVRGMVRNHSLARTIHDAAWFELRRQLAYKAEWYGRDLVVVDRWYPSSKRCSSCGYVAEQMTLRVRIWTCPS